MASHSENPGQGTMPGMSSPKYPHLSRRDFEHIERLGIPVGNTTGLYVVNHLGDIQFTPRGREFVQAAFERFGIDKDPGDLSYTELLLTAQRVSKQLHYENKQRMQVSLLSGKLPKGESTWARCYLA